jgi:arylsulfatase A
MKRHLILLALLAFLCGQSPAPAASKPNIIVIMADEVVCTIDFAASFAALTGQPLADTACLDSQNILPALLGEPSAKGRAHLLQQSNDGTNLGLRSGDWKLVRLKQRGKSQATVSLNEPALPAGSFALYHLPTDPGERTDVSAKHPEEFKRLQAEMDRLVTAGRTRVRK